MSNPFRGDDMTGMVKVYDAEGQLREMNPVDAKAAVGNGSCFLKPPGKRAASSAEEDDGNDEDDEDDED